MAQQNGAPASPGRPSTVATDSVDDLQQPAAGETPSAADPERNEDRLEALLADAERRVEEQREAMLRALADADNARKRAQADVAQAHKYALERFAESLLPVLDSLEAALNAEQSTPDTLRSGVELTLRQFLAAFSKVDVREIAPAPGDRFDPHRHQAMATVESTAEPNSIASTLQKGWLLNDRVLRPALVTVAKPPAQAPEADAAGE